MNNLTEEKKAEIIKVLSEKGVTALCPMCGNKNFVVADAYFNNSLQDSPGAIHIGGSSIPTIPIICTNCGFVSQHALGVLGLLSKPEEKRDEK